MFTLQMLLFGLLRKKKIDICFLIQMEEMRKEVEAMQASSRDYSSKLATLTRQLEDRDNKLRRMSAERQKHLEEVYEMK